MAKVIGTKPALTRPRALSPKQVLEQAVLDLAFVAGDPRGRRVLWQIITESGLWQRIRAPSPDIHFLEGRRDVGAWLQDWLNHVDPNLVPLMMQEQVNANVLEPIKRDNDNEDASNG